MIQKSKKRVFLTGCRSAWRQKNQRERGHRKYRTQCDTYSRHTHSWLWLEEVGVFHWGMTALFSITLILCTRSMLQLLFCVLFCLSSSSLSPSSFSLLPFNSSISRSVWQIRTCCLLCTCWHPGLGPLRCLSCMTAVVSSFPLCFLRYCSISVG